MRDHPHGAVSDGDMVVNGSTGPHMWKKRALFWHMCHTYTTYSLPAPFSHRSQRYEVFKRRNIRFICTHRVCNTNVSRMQRRHIKHAQHRTDVIVLRCAEFQVARSSILHHPCSLELGCHRSRLSCARPARDPRASNDKKSR